MCYLIPLLAEAIRKAERVAIAMESKGFTGSTDRTHDHRLVGDKRDWLFLVPFIGVFFVIVFVMYWNEFHNCQNQQHRYGCGAKPVL